MTRPNRPQEPQTATRPPSELGFEVSDIPLLARALRRPGGHQRLGPRVRREGRSARPPPSGTRARSPRGRSSRRPRRSGSTASRRWPSSGPTPPGSRLPIVNEELFWGDAGIGMSIFGTTLAVAGIYSSGTPEQMLEWVPQCYGTPDDVKVAAFCASEPDAGSDVSALPHHRQVRRGQRRVGAERPEGLGDQRRHRRRPRRRRLGRSRAGLARPRRLRHPARHQGLRAGRQGQEARASAPATPPTSTSTTAGSRAPACWAARRSSTSASPAPARARAPRARRR